METTLPLPFIPGISLENGSSKSDDGLTRTQLSYLGCVYVTTNSQNIEALSQFLQGHVGIEVYVDVTAIEALDDIISILDAGARKVFVAPSHVPGLQAFADRILPVFSAQDPVPADEITVNGVLIKAEKAESLSSSFLQSLKTRKVSPIFFASPTTDISSTLQAAADISAIPIIPETHLTLDKVEKGLVSVPTLIANSWSSDRPDGLIPTVVTNEGGVALGLVYSSEESLKESIKSGTGVYQSRKRGLWYKGATSGDTQELVRIFLDCDQDCLKFVVRQTGRGM
jgi:phosphoribosyl-ATP pyrophosphohydrolase / phosphoribosyl-AMP cyclohydrolase / histidinol dehydrogenase